MATEKMPKNSMNGLNNRKGNSFELLDDSDGGDSITVQTTSLYGHNVLDRTVRTDASG
jgi:hypothetical protein